MVKNAKIVITSKNGNRKNQISNGTRNSSVKVNVMWHFIAEFLEVIKSYSALLDEGFACRYNELLTYVYGKNDMPFEKDIINKYVVYELET